MQRQAWETTIQVSVLGCLEQGKCINGDSTRLEKQIGGTWTTLRVCPKDDDINWKNGAQRRILGMNIWFGGNRTSAVWLVALMGISWNHDQRSTTGRSFISFLFFDSFPRQFWKRSSGQELCIFFLCSLALFSVLRRCMSGRLVEGPRGAE